MTVEQLMCLAEEVGFTHCGSLNMQALKFMPEVRAMCASDKCRNYNRSWSCPPACGTLEEMEEKVRGYSAGVLVQTTAVMEDSFDIETMMNASKEHKEHFHELHDRLIDMGEKCLFMGSGGCNVCKECTYPDTPCRFPERSMPSMEACGLLVSDVCKDSGLPYYYGKDTLTYTACILI